MLRSRCLASLVFTALTFAAVATSGGCSNDDSLLSTDSPVPVVVPGTSSAQCTAPTSTCVLAATDVSTDTGLAISAADPGPATDGSVMAASQGVCAYAPSSDDDDGGTSSGPTFTVTYYCGLTEEASTAYVDAYKDQVTDDTATEIAALGDYSVWIPDGSSGSVAALEGDAYVTVVFTDPSGATSGSVAQASAAAVAKGYLAALF